MVLEKPHFLVISGGVLLEIAPQPSVAELSSHHGSSSRLPHRPRRSATRGISSSSITASGDRPSIARTPVFDDGALDFAERIAGHQLEATIREAIGRIPTGCVLASAVSNAGIGGD